VERCERVSKWRDAPVGQHHVVVNTEWGGLAVPSLPRLPADDVVDAQSPNVGQQTLEKMISGLYQGKIAALTLLRLDEQHSLLDDQHRSALRSGALTTPLLSALVNDASPHHSASQPKLSAALGAPLSKAALACLAAVGLLVTRRAARLAAAALVALLTFGDGAGEHASVAVDGGLFEHHAVFAAALRDTVSELGVRATLKLTADGSGVGAALLAAAAASSPE